MRKDLNSVLQIYLKYLIYDGNRGHETHAMAPHSSTLAWRILWTEEPGRLQSMGSLGVGHNWATSLSLFTFLHWKRKWQPSPVFLPGESQGQGEPGGLPSMGSHRVGHNWSDLAVAVVNLNFVMLSLFIQQLLYYSRSKAQTNLMQSCT